MIRHSTPSDHNMLYHLWHDSFGDDMEYIHFYFNQRHQDKNMLVFEEAGKIVGMLSLLPITLCWGENNYPSRYIYAVATDSRCRGKGIATALLHAAHRFIDDHGEWAAILSPSSAALFDFYKKFGYEQFFSIHEKTIQSRDILSFSPFEKISMRIPSAEEISQIRNRFFSNNMPFVQWSGDALKYIIDVFQNFEQGALFFEDGNAQGYALCGKNEKTIYIYEMAHLGITEADALSFIHQYWGASNEMLRTAEKDSNASTAKPFGMIRLSASLEQAFENNYPYLGLALD